MVSDRQSGLDKRCYDWLAVMADLVSLRCAHFIHSRLLNYKGKQQSSDILHNEQRCLAVSIVFWTMDRRLLRDCL